MTDVGLIRKLASAELGKRALADLTREPDDSLESIHLSKLAHVEDPDLYSIALSMGGDPIGNYETLGGTFRKQAFGTPMFQATAAPDPVVQTAGVASGMKGPTSSSAGPKPPSPTSSTGSSGGSSMPSMPSAAGASSVPQPSMPSITGATGQSAGGQ